MASHNLPILTLHKATSQLQTKQLMWSCSFFVEDGPTLLHGGRKADKKYIKPKDKFRIEPRYAHKKKLKQINILETDHPRSLKFDTFLFLRFFDYKIVFISQF